MGSSTDRVKYGSVKNALKAQVDKIADKTPQIYPSVHRAVTTTERMYTTTMLVSGNCHSLNSHPIPVAALTNTNTHNKPHKAVRFKNPALVTAVFLLPLVIYNYSPPSKGTQGKSVVAEFSLLPLNSAAPPYARFLKGCRLWLMIFKQRRFL